MFEQPDSEVGETGVEQPGIDVHPAAMVEREKPKPDPARAALVKQWLDDIKADEKHWEPQFKRMKKNAAFARGEQWARSEGIKLDEDDRYVANITLRHINQRVAAIYAKNPRVQAERRPKLFYVAWDGTPEMMMAAVNTINPAPIQPGQMPPQTLDPQTAMQVIRDYEDGRSKRTLYNRLGKTLEHVAQYSLDEPIPKFKTQAKQLVRRVATCGVGYLKLGFQRYMQPSPDIDAKIKDSSDRLAHLESLMMGVAEGEYGPDSRQAAELKLNLAALQKQKELLLREGLVFGFPKSWNIIPDRGTVQLKGFVGSRWIAEKFIFTPEQVERIYKVDVKESFTAYTPEKKEATGAAQSKFCCVYEVYDLVGQVKFTLCDGWPDFIAEPDEPDVFLEQFHPYYTLSFNDVEDEDCIFPPSDVDLIRPMQVERNRAREGLRVHRQANRPAYMSGKDVFEEDTKVKFATHADHELIEHNRGPDVDMSKLIQPKPTIPIDEALYSTQHLDQDALLVTGSQSATLGPTSGATATEVGVAETNRGTDLSSNTDDLDEFLSDVMRGAGQILLLNMSEQTVKKIAGEGAVWPTMSRQEVAEELCLQIKAGSSGRPNRQAKLMAIEKTGPLLMQVPGFKAKKMAELLLEQVDETLEVEDFYEDGQPSIVSMNNAKEATQGYSPTPAAQGPQGGNNAPAPAESAGKTQNLNPGIGAGPGQGAAPPGLPG